MSKHSDQWMRDTREQISVDLWRVATAISIIATEIRNGALSYDQVIVAYEASVVSLGDMRKILVAMKRNASE